MSGGRRLIVYTDGAARGNPGPAGAGVFVVDEDGEVVAEAFRSLGTATNNVAEYSALLLGLERARQLGADEVEIRADSELMVRQMRGEYRIQNPKLRKLASEAQALARSFSNVAYVHVRRRDNADADRLANRAIDEAKAAPSCSAR